jgi:hypothetical protein
MEPHDYGSEMDFKDSISCFRYGIRIAENMMVMRAFEKGKEEDRY